MNQDSHENIVAKLRALPLETGGESDATEASQSPLEASGQDQAPSVAGGPPDETEDARTARLLAEHQARLEQAEQEDREAANRAQALAEAKEALRAKRTQSIARAMSEFRPFHSGFQIDRFIVGMSAETPWGAFTQVTREIATRFESLKLDYLAAGRLQIDREEAIHLADTATEVFHAAVKKAAKTYREVENPAERQGKIDDAVRSERYAKRRAEMNRTEILLKLDSLYRTIKDKERELGRFIGHFDALLALLEKDGPLDDAKKERLEVELWMEKCRISFAGDLLSSSSMSDETLALLNAFDPAEKVQLLEFMSQPRDKIQQWMLERKAHVPPSDIIDASDVRNLICG